MRRSNETTTHAEPVTGPLPVQLFPCRPIRSTRNPSPNYVDDIGVESNDEIGRPSCFNGEREYPSPLALKNEGKEPRERQRLTFDEFIQQKESVRLQFIIRTLTISLRRNCRQAKCEVLLIMSKRF